MMPEWSDDPGTRYTVRLRCVEPQDFCDTCNAYRSSAEHRYDLHGCKGSFEGCGWRGTVRAVRQYGAVTLAMEECPECGGAVEATDGD